MHSKWYQFFDENSCPMIVRFPAAIFFIRSSPVSKTRLLSVGIFCWRSNFAVDLMLGRLLLKSPLIFLIRPRLEDLNIGSIANFKDSCLLKLRWISPTSLNWVARKFEVLEVSMTDIISVVCLSKIGHLPRLCLLGTLLSSRLVLDLDECSGSYSESS
jgi:hypothetical protein